METAALIERRCVQTISKAGQSASGCSSEAGSGDSLAQPRHIRLNDGDDSGHRNTPLVRGESPIEQAARVCGMLPI